MQEELLINFQCVTISGKISRTFHANFGETSGKEILENFENKNFKF